MRKFRKSFRYGEKGFTLIELLIVIAILGVLAAVVIPNVARFTQSGQKAAAMQEKETVQTAIDAAMAEAGMTALTVTATSPQIGSGDPATDTWTITDGTKTADVNEFLRRPLEGYWIPDDEGLIATGAFKDVATGVDYWDYTAPSTWVWQAMP